MLARETGYSFVAQESLDKRVVTLNAAEVDLDQLMDMIGRRISADIHRTGTVFYIGDFQQQDRALLVRRVRRLDAAEVREAISVIQSPDGRVSVYEDGLTVIADRLQVITRIANLLDQIESADTSVWVLQFYLLSLTDSALVDIGIDTTPQLELAMRFAQSSAGGTSTAALTGALESVLRAADERSDAELVIEHLSILRDGITEDFFEGEQFPIRVERTSDEGTSTTSGVEFVDTGLEFESTLREYSEDKARLRLKVSLSELVGIVDGFAPQTTQTRFTSDSIISNGGVYLLRSHRSAQQTNRDGTLLSLGQFEQDQERTLQLWVRAARVVGPAVVRDPVPAGNEDAGSRQPSQPERLPQPAG